MQQLIEIGVSADPSARPSQGREGTKAADAALVDLIHVRNPCDGSLVGTVPDLPVEAVTKAIEAACAAFPRWRHVGPRARAVPLRRWAELVEGEAEALASLITLEQGKPLAEARGEVAYGASFLYWFAEEGPRAYGDTIPSHLEGSWLLTTREPIGVVAAVTPWNFPLAMIARKAGAALAAGCPVIVQPSMQTPLSALALVRLGWEAGIASDVLQVVTGEPARIGRQLALSPTIRGLSFTGSTEVGRLLATLSAPTIKRVSLELGGFAPFIVLADADLEQAVAHAIAAKFATSGQDCLAVNRIFVETDLYEAFCDRFVQACHSLRVGPGGGPEIDIGPLIHEAAVAKCVAQIEDACAQGATVLMGGGVHPAGPCFLQPTVVAGVTDAMLIAEEETFGPVAAITPFDDPAAVIARANDSIYGLAAYVQGRDLSRVLPIARALDYGMVAINTPRFTGSPIPFGGFRQSGLGREGGRHGIDEFTEIKYTCIGGLTDFNASARS